jgi:hypothetical protein
MNCAFVIPLRNSLDEVLLCKSLLTSVVLAEGESWPVWIVHDGELTDVSKETLRGTYRNIKFTSNPRQGIGYGRNGGMACGILTAIAAMEQLGCLPDFVVKLDCDAIVLRKFTPQIEKTLQLHPKAGILGTLGATPRKNWDGFFEDISAESPFTTFVSIAATEIANFNRDVSLDCFCSYDFDRCFPQHLSYLDRPIFSGVNFIIKEEQSHLHDLTLEVLLVLAPLIYKAIEQGLTSKLYCSGGAYALSRSFMSDLSRTQLLTTNLFWRYIPYGEDQIMALLAFAFGKRLIDCSSPGDVFAIQIHGLPFPLDILHTLGYGIAHSVRP